LNGVAEKFDSLTVKHDVNHNLNVTMNGAEVLASLEPKLRQMAITLFNNEINKLLAQKFPNIGSYNPTRTS